MKSYFKLLTLLAAVGMAAYAVGMMAPTARTQGSVSAALDSARQAVRTESLLFLKPQNIVNIDDTFPVPGYGEVVVYTVPQDMWLVVTDVEVEKHATFFTNPNVDLAEKLVGSTTVKRSAVFMGEWMDLDGATPTYTNGAPYHSSVGLAFTPGSDVVLVNQSASADSAHITMSGYLSK